MPPGRYTITVAVGSTVVAIGVWVRYVLVDG